MSLNSAVKTEKLFIVQSFFGALFDVKTRSISTFKYLTISCHFILYLVINYKFSCISYKYTFSCTLDLEIVGCGLQKGHISVCLHRKERQQRNNKTHSHTQIKETTEFSALSYKTMRLKYFQPFEIRCIGTVKQCRQCSVCSSSIITS